LEGRNMNVGDKISNEEIIKYMEENLSEERFKEWIEKFLDRVFRKRKMTPMSYLKFLMGQSRYRDAVRLYRKNKEIEAIRRENEELKNYVPGYDVGIERTSEVGEETKSKFLKYLISYSLDKYGASAVPSLKKLLPGGSVVFDEDGFLVVDNYSGGSFDVDALGVVAASMPECDKAVISAGDYTAEVLKSGRYSVVSMRKESEGAGVAAASEVCVREDGYANLVRKYLGDAEVVIETNEGTYKLDPIPGGGSDPTLPEGVEVKTYRNGDSTEQNNKQDNYNKINLNALDDIRPC